MSSKDRAKNFFTKKMNDKERAIFESGIGLAAIYHQFIGTPVNGEKESIKHLEEAISNAVLLQPFKKKVKVKLNVKKISSIGREYNYRSLEGKDFDVTIITKYGKYSVTSRMKYVPKLKYVLMFVENIDESS